MVVAAEPSPVAGYVVAIARYGQHCELRPTPDNFPSGGVSEVSSSGSL